jgi:hypothetical protein
MKPAEEAEEASASSRSAEESSESSCGGGDLAAVDCLDLSVCFVVLLVCFVDCFAGALLARDGDDEVERVDGIVGYQEQEISTSKANSQNNAILLPLSLASDSSFKG